MDATLNQIPEKLAEMVELFDSVGDRTERVEVLISIAEPFSAPSSGST